MSTLKVVAKYSEDRDSAGLADLFEAHHFSAEDWTASIRRLCKACSESSITEHEHSTDASPVERNFGLACPLGLASSLLDEWVAANPATRSFERLEAV